LATLSPLEVLSDQLQAVEREYQALGELDEQLGRLSAAIAATTREEGDWARRCAELSVLDPLQPPYVPNDMEPLRSLTRTIASGIERVAMESAESEVIAQLCEPPVLGDAKAIEAVCAAISAETSTWECCTAIDATISPLAPLPEFHETKKLETAIDMLDAARFEVEQHGQSLDVLASELAAVEQSIRQWARVNPICRTCGAPVEPERLLAGAPAAHGSPTRQRGAGYE
jgi:hypothetical protein